MQLFATRVRRPLVHLSTSVRWASPVQVVQKLLDWGADVNQMRFDTDARGPRKRHRNRGDRPTRGTVMRSGRMMWDAEEIPLEVQISHPRWISS